MGGGGGIGGTFGSKKTITMAIINDIRNDQRQPTTN
jgi:hypothetical protein